MTGGPSVPSVPSAGTPTRLLVLTAPSNTIQVDRATRRGETPLTIANTSGRALRARGRLVVENQAAAGWFSFAPDGPAGAAATAGTAAVGTGVPAAPSAVGAEAEWDLAPGEARQVRVQIAAPQTATAGIYTVRPEVWHVDDPAKTLVPGPTLAATVPEPLEKKRPTRWWLWLIPVGVAVVLAASVLGALWVSDNNERRAAEATATSEAIGTATAESAAAATAAAGDERAKATATAVAQVGRYTGTWLNSDKASPQVTQLNVTAAGMSLTVTMRGKTVDVVSGGSWTQKTCGIGMSECQIGTPAQVTYGGDPVRVDVPSAPPLIRRLTITPTPSSTLSVVEQIVLSGAVKETNGYTFSRQKRGLTAVGVADRITSIFTGK